MTARRAKFIEEYLITLNATKAAMLAGYSKKTAYSIGAGLLKEKEIKEELHRLMTERQSANLLTRVERQRFWQDIMLNEEIDVSTRIKASELLAKSFGDFDPIVIERERRKYLPDEELKREVVTAWEICSHVKK